MVLGMARVTVEDCLEHENNRFSLIILAAKRAKQLLAGSPLTIPSTDNKSIVNALREIAAGNVRYMNEEDLQKRRKKEEDERQAALEKAAQESAAIEAKSAELQPPTNGTSNGNGSAPNSVPTTDEDDSE